MSDLGADVATHTEEDENYFISMTDMMVGVLFIFIILLMVFALNFRQQTDVKVEQIERLQRAADTAKKVETELRALQERVNLELKSIADAESAKRDLLVTLKARLKEQGLDVEIDVQNGVLRLGENAINFALDDDRLSVGATERVRRLAVVLSEVLPSFAFKESVSTASLETMFVEGHTDKQGGDQRNWELSTQRAVNTFWELVRQQPSLLDLENLAGTQVLSAAGYGSTRPVPGTDPDLRDVPQNRRIDLRFVMDVDNGERLRELQYLTQDMEGRLTELHDAVEQAVVE